MKADLITFLPELRAFSRFLCGARNVGDDLLQDTVSTALSMQDQIADTDLKAWLFALMRARVYSEPHDDGLRHANDAIECSIAAVPTDQVADLARAMRRLHPKYREALILVCASGFSYEQAARLCGCKAGTIKARETRARRMLADAMN